MTSDHSTKTKYDDLARLAQEVLNGGGSTAYISSARGSQTILSMHADMVAMADAWTHLRSVYAFYRAALIEGSLEKLEFASDWVDEAEKVMDAAVARVKGEGK